MSTTTARPPAALWDALLAAGGSAAALALLGQIDRGEDWRRPAAGPSATTGSGWDAAQGPDVAAPHHLGEWVTGSAVHPALAAANVATLQGAPALEALAGDRLEQLGGWGQQYATGAVARLLRPLEPVAAAGGWWCSGLDPLTDWAPMGWGCFKPDRPRIEARDGKGPRARKYEHPIATPARSFWLRVPAAVAQLVADRFAVALPAAVAADGDGSAGAFWRWWAQTPSLPLLLTEGAKKAAALLSVGVPAVALPGIWNGAPKNPDGVPTLLPELAAVPLAGRPVSVLFDYSDSEQARRDVAAASRRLGRLLERAGAGPVLLGVCPGPHKGADDALAAGLRFEQLAAQLEPLAAAAALPVLPHLRRHNQTAPDGARLNDQAPVPEPLRARVVALAAPMGCGKTYAIGQRLGPYLADGLPVLNLTHRVSLGQAQSEAWGLPWAPEPGSDERLQGGGLCWDSCCPNSGLRIRPGEWGGAVVVLDEWAQGVEHLLFGHGTALAQRRPAVLETAAQLLASARQIIVSDAQLSDPVLELIEALTGERAYLIASEHRPMAGRRLFCPQGLTAAEASERGRGKVLELIEAGRPFFCWSSSQTAGSKNSPQNLARLHRQRRPDARLLVIDSDNPEAAERLAADPDGVAAGLDAIYCSPSIASGLSIDLRNHFAAVVVLGGGTVGPEHLAQAAARVRDPLCPVFAFAPKQSPGGALRIGSGDTDPAALLRHLARCESQLLAQLTAAGGWDPMARNESPWLRCYLELAAFKNRQRLAYAATVAGLLEREGWAIEAPPEPTPAAALAAAMASDQLAAIARDAQAAEDAALIAAAPLTAADARELERKRRHSPEERAQLQRYRLAHRWGLGAADPTPALIEADRDELSSRARFGWALGSIEGRQLAARHDARRSQQLAPDGQAWGPDLLRELLGHKIAAADALGLPGWLERADTGEWFTAADPQLQQLQHHLAGRPRPEGGESLDQEAQRLAFNARAAIDRAAVAASLGVSPGKRATTTLRSLLALAGFELEAKRARGPDGQLWRYRIRPTALPDGIDRQRLEAAWRDQLADPGGG